MAAPMLLSHACVTGLYVKMIVKPFRFGQFCTFVMVAYSVEGTGPGQQFVDIPADILEAEMLL